VDWKPDLIVKYGAESANGNGYMTTSYLVVNYGNFESGAVALKGECMDMDGNHTIQLAKVVGGFAKGESRTIYVNCWLGWASQLTVSTQNDSNTSNNKAHSTDYI
jgi:hypothetical protein